MARGDTTWEAGRNLPFVVVTLAGMGFPILVWSFLAKKNTEVAYIAAYILVSTAVPMIVWAMTKVGDYLPEFLMGPIAITVFGMVLGHLLITIGFPIVAVLHDPVRGEVDLHGGPAVAAWAWFVCGAIPLSAFWYRAAWRAGG